jgi:hypothetical protein
VGHPADEYALVHGHEARRDSIVNKEIQ